MIFKDRDISTISALHRHEIRTIPVIYFQLEATSLQCMYDTFSRIEDFSQHLHDFLASYDDWSTRYVHMLPSNVLEFIVFLHTCTKSNEGILNIL